MMRDRAPVGPRASAGGVRSRLRLLICVLAVVDSVVKGVKGLLPLRLYAYCIMYENVLVCTVLYWVFQLNFKEKYPGA